MTSTMWSPDTKLQFKACRLCAAITDDSVELKKDMKDFLVHFLDIKSAHSDIKNEFCNLPQKICITCFQDCCDAKRFKERCKKAFEKINKLEKIAPKSFILGMSTDDEDENALQSHEDVIKSPQQETAFETSNNDDSRAPRSKTKNVGERLKTSSLNKSDENDEVLRVENCDPATVKKYLKNKPVCFKNKTVYSKNTPIGSKSAPVYSKNKPV